MFDIQKELTGCVLLLSISRMELEQQEINIIRLKTCFYRD